MWNDGTIAVDWREVPIAIYSELGKEVWRAEFGPFGEPLYERGVSNYIPFRLYGMYKDMETGLYYNVRRYYDWRVGRYLQPDPVSDLNLYVYVNNSPYDAVDPVGMFEVGVKWSPYFVPLLHVGVDPNHEEITENAISELYRAFPGKYSKLYQYGFRLDDWNGGVYLQIGTLAFQCRADKKVRPDADRVAQGANVADCFFFNDSSYHCDNSNFKGCDEKGFKILNPLSNGLVTCWCDNSGDRGSPPPVYPPPHGGGPGKGEVRGCSSDKGSQTQSYPPPSEPGESEIRGCSKGSQTPSYRLPIGPGEDNGRGYSVSTHSKQRLKNSGGGGGGYSVVKQRLKKKSSSCKCYFKGNLSYQDMGILLHAVQDFWSHSNAVFVPNCAQLWTYFHCNVWSDNLCPYLSECMSNSSLDPRLKKDCTQKYIILNCRCLQGTSTSRCLSYSVQKRYIGQYLPSDISAGTYGLFTGLYDGGGWSKVDDAACSAPYPLQPLLGLPSPAKPPCDLQSRTMAHCMLNKDGVGANDRECLNACDQGDWNGDCAGRDNIQRFAFNDAKELGVSTTKNYLTLFCLLAGPNICY